MANPRNEIVFVCTANTCRSPMAEGLFRHALLAQDEPMKSLVVSSAGVSTYDKQPPANNAVIAMSKVGIDIKNHKSLPITEELIDRALAFFAMTDTHLAMLSFRVDPPPSNAFLMRQFIEADANDEIPDPFGMSLNHYEACRDSMVEAIPSLLQVVKTLYEAQLGGQSVDQ
ncbi:MAG: low molecular weight protein arginine phosphatase [Opitutaceae bacterium]|nr:low molecular weight protein arginine phosphatase [Opitutaceae bacterium]